MAFLKFKPLISNLNFRSSINLNELPEDINDYLIDNEEVVLAYKAYRDVVAFTNKRILLIDKKGINGFRRTVFSILYRSISSYSLNIRTIDSTIDITTDSGYKLSFNFLKPIPLDDMFKVYRYLANKILNDSK
jgi:hypothetical protein